jgi:hypothetical protein
MTPDERAQLIAKFRDGPAAFEAAVEGIGDDELDARAAPGEWTPREIVHHLADSELRSAVRLRQLLAEDDPIIQGYDEVAYTERLQFSRSVAASLAAVKAARASSGEMLELLTEQDWKRSGTHTESGAYSVETWLQVYAAHAHDHAEQLKRAREVAAATER